VEHITNIFGTLHPNDVFYLKASTKEELPSFADFRDFVSRNSLSITIFLQKFRAPSATSPRFNG
jgi:hypothetical protein